MGPRSLVPVDSGSPWAGGGNWTEEQDQTLERLSSVTQSAAPVAGCVPVSTMWRASCTERQGRKRGQALGCTHLSFDLRLSLEKGHHFLEVSLYSRHFKLIMQVSNNKVY